MTDGNCGERNVFGLYWILSEHCDDRSYVPAGPDFVHLFLSPLGDMPVVLPNVSNSVKCGSIAEFSNDEKETQLPEKRTKGLISLRAAQFRAGLPFNPLNIAEFARLLCPVQRGVIKKELLASRKNTDAGRPRSVRTGETIQKVMVSVLAFPELSLNRRMLELNLSRTTLQRCLKGLNLKPYKMHRVHELKEADYGERVYFCNVLVDMFNDNPMLLYLLLCVDEAKFFLNGVVSSSHARFWALEQPEERLEQSLDKRGVMVFAGMTASHDR
ncbi:hypothetical protein B566_EDAN017550 [Ephemera danica]|nr:hypothetical protein B566_EDAN017550 [Ephemera danica]